MYTDAKIYFIISVYATTAVMTMHTTKFNLGWNYWIIS